MTKKHFISLADMIREHNNAPFITEKFTPLQLEALASFCKQENGNFMASRWLDYIAGKCGKNGGSVK